MRKLIEIKLENARNDLENVNQKQRNLEYELLIQLWTEKEYEEQMIRLSSEEERLNGAIETYEDLLNSKELSELESKAEKYDRYNVEIVRLPHHHLTREDYENKIHSDYETIQKLREENQALKEGIEAIENKAISTYAYLITHVEEFNNAVKLIEKQ